MIDLDYFVDVFESFDGLVWTRLGRRAVKMLCERVVKNVFDECGLTRARYAGDDGQQPEGKRDINLFQVIGVSAANNQVLSVRRSSFRRNLNLSRATNV